MRRLNLLKSYDELLDLAQSKGLHVFEEQPLDHCRGFIFVDTILLKAGLSEYDKRAVLTEEIMHFDRDYGDITQLWNREIRTHRRVIESNISLFEFIDAIIDNGEYATPYSVAETLQIPEWMYYEILDYYSILPYEDMHYRGHIVKFNPLHIF